MSVETMPAHLRPLVEDARYACSEAGEIWSSLSGSWVKLNPGPITKQGHLGVALANPLKGGKPRFYYVARLVARAWIGEIPDGVLVCHRDDNPSRNCVENLYIGNRQSNAEDAIRNGRVATGKDWHAPKLTPESVLEILELSRAGTSQCEIARRYSVDSTTVSKILSGERLSSVTGIPKKARNRSDRGEALPRPRARLTDDDVRRALELSEAGWGQEAIGRELGCSRKHVSAIVRGLARREAGVSDEQAREIVALRQAGLPLPEIAAKYGCSRQAASLIARGLSRNDATGLPRGTKGVRASRLRADQVGEIVALSEAGMSQGEISIRLSVHNTTVSNILLGKRRSSVTGIPQKAKRRPSLTAEQVLEIVALSQAGVLQREIAKKFGISKPAVSAIVCGRIWSHLTGI
jgi:transcriptional regulator